MKKFFFLGAMAVIFILGLANFPLAAADYPTKPITIIVTVSPGGSNDIQCRAFASVADKLLGQPIVVTNKPGASGMIGLLAGAQAAADGYTLTGGSTSDMCALEWEIANGRKPPASRPDFIPIGTFTFAPLLIAVPSNSPWKTLADLINDAKAKPGHYAFGSGGLYRIAHVNTELFIRAVGLKFRHVPYAGGGPALSALVGNHVDFAAVTVSSSIPLVRGNKLRILAVQSNQRIKSLPDTPALKELGIDAELRMWIGLWAPQRTPRPIVEKLRKVLQQVTEDKSFINIIETQGDEVHFMGGEEWAKYLDTESEKLARIYKQIFAEEKEKKGK
ncbi:MAG: tripartite tricarboxylate transporter substrate binding protein [Deltaproteobacteria bacterium]|nr:tripartite tricarboxylate transporter substrate binding protein [Deltaproteobacteria bacterium]